MSVLDPVDGAGVDEHPPDRLDARELEVVTAEEALDDLALGSRRGVEGVRDEDRALALTQVVAGRLAGGLGSPKTPSRSSRSWNASPSARP